MRTLASLSTLCVPFMEHELNEGGALKERRRTLKRTENKKIMLKKEEILLQSNFFYCHCYY